MLQALSATSSLTTYLRAGLLRPQTFQFRIIQFRSVDIVHNLATFACGREIHLGFASLNPEGLDHVPGARATNLSCWLSLVQDLFDS
jgi:hypothetical protein